MKDLLLLPFYISAFFSNLFFADIDQEVDKDEKFKLHIEINIDDIFKKQDENPGNEDNKNREVIQLYDQDLINQEQLENNSEK